MNEKINERIKIIRKSLKLSQEEFSKTLGISQNRYSDFERGKSAVTERIKISITSIHDVNKAWLENGDGEIFISKNSSESKKDRTIEFLSSEIKRMNSERELLIRLLDSKDALIEYMKKK